MPSARQCHYRFVSPVAPLVIIWALSAGMVNAQDSELDDEMSSVDVTAKATTDATNADEAVDSEIGPGDEGWIDGGHNYASRKANEMTQWVDNFFGNDERDLEQAESRLRLRTCSVSSSVPS